MIQARILLSATFVCSLTHIGLGARLRASSSAHLALQRSHIESLCPEDAIIEGCGLLGAHPDANASVKHLAEVLVADESETVNFLKTLGLEANRTFGCRAFCEATVAHIPTILKTSAPLRPGEGCVDDNCTEDIIDLSTDALIREGLETPPPDATDYNLTLPTEPNSDLPSIDPSLRGQVLLRTALNVIFGIFPAPSGQDAADLESTRPKAISSKRRKAKVVNDGKGTSVDVEFGPKVNPSRHRSYQEYSLKASAWISIALRKLKPGSHLVKKWFILGTEAETQVQMREARRHLTRMLQLTNWFIIKKGVPAAEGGPCKVEETAWSRSGTLAYVYKRGFCGVNSYSDCGEKTRDSRHVINICDFYWSSIFNSATRIGTIIHESSHHFGTDDKGYCSSVDCLALSSADARNNADTYTELVKELVSDRRVREESDGIPNTACNTMCGASTFADWDFENSFSGDACGQCEETFRLVGDCGDKETWATGTLKKLCCSSHQCQTTTTTTMPPCPEFSASPHPNEDGLCSCRSGYGCSQSGRSLDCPERRDMYGRGYFSVSCSTCKCYRVQQRRNPWNFGGWF